MDTDQPGSLPPQEPQKRSDSFARQLALALELPFIPIIAIGVGGGLGYLLDSRAHTSPLFTFGLGALGFAAGMREIFRRLAKEEKRDSGQ